MRSDQVAAMLMKKGYIAHPRTPSSESQKPQPSGATQEQKSVSQPVSNSGQSLITDTHKAVIDKLHSHIDSQTHLQPETKQKYKDAIHKVISNMNETSAKHIHDNLTDVDWHGDTGSLTHAYRKARGLSHGPGINIGKHISGFYDQQTGKAGLDGAEDSSNIAGIYAHELGHAIDRHYRYSSQPEWKHAYTREIIGNMNGPAPLTEHARRNNAAEGMADWLRGWHSGERSKEDLKTNFPLSYDFFKKHGLVD